MRRCTLLLLAPALGCAACSSETDEGEQEMIDQQVIAEVEKANEAEPPLREVVPEPILYPDIERHDLYGAACSYAPGTSLGARVIARPADAFMKIDGKMVRFAADPGARQLAQETRSLYNSREYSLRLDLNEAGEGSEPDAATYAGDIVLRDSYDRIVYRGTGEAQCGA